MCCRTTRCNRPPNVTVEPPATFGPSFPHLFLELLSAKWACIGKGEALWVKAMYWFGDMVKDRSSILNFETLPVTVMKGFVFMFKSPSKGMSCIITVFRR